MYKYAVFILICLLAIPCGVHGLVARSGDQVVIAEPFDDDVFASGGSVRVLAPIHSLVAAGGEVVVDAPIEGDVIAAGGSIRLNAPVGGKVILAGGEVTLNGSVERNALAYAGDVVITPAARIAGDALISGGSVSHQGTVLGNLSVSGREFSGTGTAGNLTWTPGDDTFTEMGHGILFLLFFLLSFGMLVLGLILLRFVPGQFLHVERELRNRPLIRGLAGLGGIIGGLILTILLAVTIIGIPLALLVMTGLLTGILLSTLFTASALGRVISTHFHRDLREWQIFVLGFVVLHILLRIPFVGWIFLAAAICLGFGALLYSLPACRDLLSAEGNVQD